jgi:hypothetical protein
MKKGYVIQYNIRCAKTNEQYPDVITPSAEYGETFADTMKDAKVGDTSVTENIEGLHWENGTSYVSVIYDEMFVVTN